MSEVEIAQLLTRIQTIDGRTTDRLTLEAWKPIVGDLRYDDATRAVAEHYGTTGDYLMPHHIVVLAAKYEDERRRELRRMMEGGSDRPPLPSPPWMREAQNAAAEATRAALAAGHTRGDQVTIRSAKEAANRVQDAWEAEHGDWNKVGYTWYDEPHDDEPF